MVHLSHFALNLQSVSGSKTQTKGTAFLTIKGSFLSKIIAQTIRGDIQGAEGGEQTVMTNIQVYCRIENLHVCY